jgi:hypothetical protein
MWMSGATLNMVLTDRYAYFASRVMNPEGTALASNVAGGFFDLVRVALANGKLERLPLPKDCGTPHMAELAGVPLLFAWDLDTQHPRALE